MECGSEFRPVCGACGLTLPDGARYCIECGAAVATAAGKPAGKAADERSSERRGTDSHDTSAHPPSPAEGNGAVHDEAGRRGHADRRLADPHSYTPRHLAERILKTRGAIEGERKQVTVLFADVKESMDLAEQVDAETWHGILDRFFSILSAGVHRFEGTINQYTGDGIMALFGAPIAHEDHAHRALYAALHLEQALLRYADELRRDHGMSFSVRIGINSGEVIVGKIGDDLRMDYTAQGHTVGLAARVESLAAPNSAYLTEHTAGLVSGYFDLRDLGEFAIKGMREPIRVYELQGIGKARTRLDVSRARGFSRFVGRAVEMQQLESAFEQVRDGHSRVVGVIGEAGAGKSRLFYEFLARRRNEGVEVLEARCAAHGQMIPYLPVLDLLRSYFGVTDQDSDQAAREKIAGRILLIDDEMKGMLPHIFDFLGVPDPGRPVPVLEPEQRRAMLAEGLRRIASRNSDTPTVIVFEDLHWIDGASETFLADLIAMLDRNCELILVNTRPGYSADWMSVPCYERIDLAPLDSAAIGHMLGELLGADPSVSGLADRIAAHTSGNPFFIEEVVRGLIGSGVLEGERGAYRVTRDSGRIEIPETLHALLAARIDRLEERDKAVLETAAVIGKDFSERLLASALVEVGVDGDALAASLRTLDAGGFIDAVRLFPDAEYVFHHPLTQEVAYRTQLAERRASIHRRVAVALEDDCCGRADDNAALLAHHWDGAGERLQTVKWSRRAAEWAATRDLAEAQRHWERIREVISDCPECPESREVAFAAREALIEIGWRQGGSLERAAQLHEEGRVLAEASGNRDELSRISAAFAMAELFSGQTERGLEHLEEALAIAEGSDDLQLVVLLNGRLAYMYLLAGRIGDCLRYADAALEVLDRNRDVPIAILAPGSTESWLEGFRTLPLVYAGDLAQAAQTLERILPQVESANDPGSSATLHGFSVTLAWFKGDEAMALRHAAEQRRIADELGSPSLIASAMDSSSVALSLAGRFAESVALAEKAVEVARTSGTLLQSESVFVANLAAACIGDGQTDRALGLAREAAEIARSRRTPLFEIRARLILARALLASVASLGTLEALESEGKASLLVEEAEATIHAALAIVESTGARGYEPFLRVELSRLARLRGEVGVADRELETARQIFAGFGATELADRVGEALPAGS